MARSDPKPQHILLPVNMAFIGLTLFFSLLANLLPFGRAPIVPDFVALSLAFWCIREPRRVGFTTAFVLGLAMDVADAALVGQHALAYTLLAYAAIKVSRRVPWFPIWQQALHVLTLLLLAQIVQCLVQSIAGGGFPSVAYFSASVSAALLWPLLSLIYLAPQRKPIDPDENRPI